MRYLLFLILTVQFTHVKGQGIVRHLPYKIDTIVFEGLNVTQEDWLRTFIQCKEGAPFSPEIYERDLQNIRNINLFFSVKGEWRVSGGQVAITIKIREAKYVYPYVYVGGFKEAFQVSLGLSNIHWKGKGGTLGIWYRYYDRHSFSAFYRMPRLTNSSLGYEWAVGKYGTVEPLYFQDQVCLVNYDLFSTSSKLYRWMGLHQRVEAGLGIFHEVYTALDEHPVAILSHPIKKNKGLISLSYILDRRDYSYEMVEGNFLELSSEYVYTLEEPQFPFAAGQVTWKNYKKLGGKWNSAFRLRLSYGTNRYSPFLPYVIDGFANVRGSGNRIARGTAMALFNFELRRRVYQNRYGIVQLVTFSDLAWLRKAGDSIPSWWSAKSNYSYAGFGGRVLLQRFYHIVLRLDYSRAIHTNGGAKGGLVFGIGQFY